MTKRCQIDRGFDCGFRFLANPNFSLGPTQKRWDALVLGQEVGALTT